MASWLPGCRFPTLSHSSDTTIYVCYGSSSISADPSNRNGTWDSDFTGVWHLTNLSAPSGTDSTANANNITATNGTTSAAGLMGGAASFNGSAGNWIDFVNNGSLNNWTQQTISLWFKAQPGGMGSYARLIEKGYNNEWTAVWNYSNAAVADNSWHQFDATISSTNLVSLYIDGVLNGTAQSSGPATKSGNFRLGAAGNGGNFYNGFVDELRNIEQRSFGGLDCGRI